MLFGLRLSAAIDTLEIKSPDECVAVRVSCSGETNARRLTYAVTYDRKPVVEESTLGLELAGAPGAGNLVFAGTTTRENDEMWRPVYGERSEIPDRYREVVILLRPLGGDAKLELVVRAYDEGVAFRYRLAERAKGGTVRIAREHTQFVLPAGTRGWFAPSAQATTALRPIAEFTGKGERPLTLALPNGLHACLAEAELVNYARMQFARDPANPNALRCELDGPVEAVAPFATPWRVIMIAEKPGQLLENNYLLLNLNPPNALADSSWIKPGKAVREMQLSTTGGLALVDFAAARRFQYVLLDAGWYGHEFSDASDATKVSVDPRRNPRNDLDLPAVIAHATAKGIGVWLYVNQRALAAQLDEILPLYAKWGVKGVKFGFVNVGSQRWTAWLHDAVRQAAAHRLMVDIHDEYRPTGFSRTYPNLLTQEGVHGNEEFPDATHNTTLPFTRYIAGAADYTICYYRREAEKSQPGRFLKTTAAHQLSLAVIYYSPLQLIFWYDVPSDYRGEPEIEFFEKVPTVWDETKVVQGEIGRYATIARRTGDEWFVGTITNNDARALEVPLSFLPAGKNYEATIYADDAAVTTRTQVGIRRLPVNGRTVLRAELQPSGGQAIWLRPVD